MLRSLFKAYSLVFIFIFSNVTYSQEIPNQLNKSEINETITSLVKLLNDEYVYPEKAQKITKLLNTNLKKGKYTKIKNELVFAEAIQQDMRSVVNDKHLFFEYSPDQVEQILEAQNESENPEIKAAQLREMQRFNFGFESVKILEGNIGYLKFNNFYDTEYASETAIAAMNFLSHTDALIIDLRQNGGGSPKMIQLLSSYLFNPEPVYLSGFYWRPSDQYTQNWTLPFVPGNRMPETDVYILTSGNTFSAAEEFTYNLKHLKRATVIGETTGGGAHPGDIKVAGRRFTVFIPNGRSTNPITHTNWEGVGVIPHIEVAAQDALATAQISALKNLSKKYSDSSGDLYRWYLVSERAKLHPVELSAETLNTYVGVYGPRTIKFENGRLFYQRSDGPKLLLNILEQDLFELAIDSSFRLKFIKEGNKIVALQGLFDNGFKDQFSKQP
ncbi:MAG: S41 family peptidase [Marinicella sp.]|nr:S41 family peptidase [Xanthomonadales bacterium]